MMKAFAKPACLAHQDVFQRDFAPKQDWNYKGFVMSDRGAVPGVEAALAASKADVVIVFATQWQTEGLDSPDLSLPHGQDALISAVTAANPNTTVVLESGGPVLMP